FVSACAAFFPKEEDHFIFARAGHNAPILFNKERDATFDLRSNGYALGMTSSNNLKQFLQEKKFRFRPGDGVLFYTDGLTEARNDVGEDYGHERLDAIMSIYGSLHAQTIVHKIQSSLENFIGTEEPGDDITVTCVHHAGLALPPDFFVDQPLRFFHHSVCRNSKLFIHLFIRCRSPKMVHSN